MKIDEIRARDPRFAGGVSHALTALCQTILFARGKSGAATLK
jgi:hypothetical protein